MAWLGRQECKVATQFALRGVMKSWLILLALALIGALWLFLEPRWRAFRYKRLFERAREKINTAVQAIGAGSSPVAVHGLLMADLGVILGPLAKVVAGATLSHPWVEDLVSVLDPNAPARKLDLELLQVRYCLANKCDHLKSPFQHTITISGTAASNHPHHITTIQQPGIEPVGAVGIPGANVPGGAPPTPFLAGSPIPLNTPAQRRFPIVVGQTHAFVEVNIQDMDSKTRIICDCPSSTGFVDLKELTGAIPPPPSVPGPPGPGPVLRGPYSTPAWPGLNKRPPSPTELGRFYSKAISSLNASWTEKNVVGFLKDLHKQMHSF